MVPAGNKAKRLSSVNHTTKTIHHHHDHQSKKEFVTQYMQTISCKTELNKNANKVQNISKYCKSSFEQNIFYVMGFIVILAIVFSYQLLFKQVFKSILKMVLCIT